jgi:ankyrin repeat protein
MVEFLLNRGVSIEAMDDLGNTALFTAVERGNYGIVKLLLDRGANLRNSRWQFPTPLSIAAEAGHEKVTALLLSRGAEANLRYAVAVDDAELFERLLKGCTNSSIAHARYGNRLFIYAIVKGNLKIVRLLIERGVVDYDSDLDESPALIEAAKRGHFAIVALLIQNGADPNRTDVSNSTARAWAMRNGHGAIAEFLFGVDSDWCI